jgi:hypothetical protein
MRNMPKLYQISAAQLAGSAGHYNHGWAKAH